MKLTDAICRREKPGEKMKKLGDGAGLALWVHPSGLKSWRLTYYAGGKQAWATLGHYPAMGLREARAAAAEKRAAGATRRQDSARPTFGAVKAEWMALIERQGRAGETLARARRMDSYSAPLDRKPINEIRPQDCLALIRPFEEGRRLETARRLRSTLSRVFRYAAAAGYCESDPAALLKGAVAAPVTTHRAALIDSDGFKRLIRAIDAYEARSPVREALLFMAYTAARPGEVRFATWGEFDLEADVWTVPAARMKMRREHRAPLARQSLQILKQLEHVSDPYKFIFPSQRPGRPLSENAFNVALRSMGFAKDEVSAHGLRSSFSTLANKSGLWSVDAIERHLAHIDQDATRRAYNRDDCWDERVRLAAWWGDFIDEMRGGK